VSGSRPAPATLDEAAALAAGYYDRVAEEYLRRFADELDAKPYDRALLDRFAALLPPRARVLDAGCGPAGHLAAHLAARGLRLTGVDVSPACVALARRAQPALAFQVADLAQLPFDAASFDAVLAAYSLIYTPRRLQPAAFAELARVLRPGGLLLLAVKAGEAEGYVDDPLGSEVRPWFTCFTVPEVRALLAGAGLRARLVEARGPLDGEIEIDRIFALAERAPNGA